MPLYDENAFGFLVAFHDIEDMEYALEPAAFAERFREFNRCVRETAAALPLGGSAHALDLGHAFYFEVGDGDQSADPITWLKRMKEALSARDFEVTLVLSHGGRWLYEGGLASDGEHEPSPGCAVRHASRPSEPLRRALHAETATHGSDGSDGWGPGTYVDSEAVEALGKSLKNAPTALSVAGATFYRIGR